jgi:hypothetical protein
MSGFRVRAVPESPTRLVRLPRSRHERNPPIRQRQGDDLLRGSVSFGQVHTSEW